MVVAVIILVVAVRLAPTIVARHGPVLLPVSGTAVRSHLPPVVVIVVIPIVPGVTTLHLPWRVSFSVSQDHHSRLLSRQRHNHGRRRRLLLYDNLLRLRGSWSDDYRRRLWLGRPVVLGLFANSVDVMPVRVLVAILVPSLYLDLFICPAVVRAAVQLRFVTLVHHDASSVVPVGGPRLTLWLSVIAIVVDAAWAIIISIVRAIVDGAWSF
jgi:hypothetical protein